MWITRATVSARVQWLCHSQKMWFWNTPLYLLPSPPCLPLLIRWHSQNLGRGGGMDNTTLCGWVNSNEGSSRIAPSYLSTPGAHRPPPSVRFSKFSHSLGALILRLSSYLCCKLLKSQVFSCWLMGGGCE